MTLLEWIDKFNFISISISDFLRSIAKLSTLDITFDTCLCNEFLFEIVTIFHVSKVKR